MADLLHRIDEALASQRLDHNDFERAAMALLREAYPTLSPVTGGGDVGRDGDAPMAEGGVVRLLATTAEDVRANLRRGLRRMAEEDVTTIAVVMATSQPVSAQERRALEEIATEHGTTLCQVHDRTWLADSLYRDAVWRERLIDVTGEPAALLPRPLGLSESPLPSVELIGRSEELDQLNAADADVVLVGATGMGKTRLAAELDNAMFVQRHNDPSRLADDLRQHRPEVVVVDDAPEHLDTLLLLRQLRQSEAVEFRILATTWPEEADEVAEQLPGARRLALPPLERVDAGRILEQLGISHYLLVGSILNQAEGRPGWVLLFGELARGGDIDQVIRGEALVEQVTRFARRVGEAPTAVDLLARVAALEPVPDDDLAKLAQQQGLPEHEATGHLRRMARHGLAEWTRAGWVVRPPKLRAALLAGHFFSRPPHASIDALMANWPEERRPAFLSAFVDAALVGATTAADRAERLMDELVAASDPLGPQLGDILERYALISRTTAEQAVAHAAEAIHDLIPPPPQPPAGASWPERVEWSAQRERWRQAAATGEAAARKFGLPAGFDLLAEMALSDPTSTNRTDHPRRRLLDLPTDVIPHRGTDRSLREEALAAALRLLDSNPPAEAEQLAAELAAAAMAPTGKGSWMDAVDPFKYSWVQTLEDPDTLDWIADTLWARWAERLPEIGDPAVNEAVGLVRRWALIGTGKSLGTGQQVPEDAQQAAREHATRMAGALRAQCGRTPALAEKWNELLERIETEQLEPLDSGPEYAALLLDREVSDVRERMARRDERLADLADAWEETKDFEEIVDQLTEWTEDAAAVDQRLGGPIAKLLEELGTRSADATGLFEEVVSSPLWRHSGGLLRVVLDRQPDRWPEWLPGLLADAQRRQLAVSMVLSCEHTPEDAIDEIVSGLDGADAPLLDQVIAQRGSPDEVVRSLLTHDEATIRASTALQFAIGEMDHGLTVPADWEEEWAEAFLEVQPDDLAGHTGWRFDQIAQQLAATNPSLLTEWFRQNLDPTSDRSWDPATAEHLAVIGDLPREHRIELIEHVRDHPLSREVTEPAVANDAGLVMQLLEDEVVDVEDLTACISFEKRGDWFEAVAPVLVNHGADPRGVAASLQFSEEAYIGEDSTRYRQIADYLSGLMDAESETLQRVARFGVEHFRELQENAEDQERATRVRGLSADG